jgi:hypothetical protein
MWAMALMELHTKEQGFPKQQEKEDSSPVQQELASENNDDFPTTSKN